MIAGWDSMQPFVAKCRPAAIDLFTVLLNKPAGTLIERKGGKPVVPKSRLRIFSVPANSGSMSLLKSGQLPAWV